MEIELLLLTLTFMAPLTCKASLLMTLAMRQLTIRTISCESMPIPLIRLTGIYG